MENSPDDASKDGEIEDCWDTPSAPGELSDLAKMTNSLLSSVFSSSADQDRHWIEQGIGAQGADLQGGFISEGGFDLLAGDEYVPGTGRSSLSAMLSNSGGRASSGYCSASADAVWSATSAVDTGAAFTDGSAGWAHGADDCLRVPAQWGQHTEGQRVGLWDRGFFDSKQYFQSFSESGAEISSVASQGHTSLFDGGLTGISKNMYTNPTAEQVEGDVGSTPQDSPLQQYEVGDGGVRVEGNAEKWRNFRSGPKISHEPRENAPYEDTKFAGPTNAGRHGAPDQSRTDRSSEGRQLEHNDFVAVSSDTKVASEPKHETGKGIKLQPNAQISNQHAARTTASTAQAGDSESVQKRSSIHGDRSSDTPDTGKPGARGSKVDVPSTAAIPAAVADDNRIRSSEVPIASEATATPAEKAKGGKPSKGGAVAPAGAASAATKRAAAGSSQVKKGKVGEPDCEISEEDLASRGSVQASATKLAPDISKQSREGAREEAEPVPRRREADKPGAKKPAGAGEKQAPKAASAKEKRGGKDARRQRRGDRDGDDAAEEEAPTAGEARGGGGLVSQVTPYLSRLGGYLYQVEQDLGSVIFMVVYFCLYLYLHGPSYRLGVIGAIVVVQLLYQAQWQATLYDVFARASAALASLCGIRRRPPTVVAAAAAATAAAGTGTGAAGPAAAASAAASAAAASGAVLVGRGRRPAKPRGERRMRRAQNVVWIIGGFAAAYLGSTLYEEVLFLDSSGGGGGTGGGGGAPAAARLDDWEWVAVSPHAPRGGTTPPHLVAAEADRLCEEAQLAESARAWPEVQAKLQAALRLDPAHVCSLYNYGRLLDYVWHKGERAELMYRRAVAASPRHVPSLRNYGYLLYYVRKDYAGAERLWRRALREAPAEFDVLSGLGLLRFHVHGDLAGAERLFQSALAASPSHPPTLLHYASLLRVSEDGDPAERLAGLAGLTGLGFGPGGGPGGPDAPPGVAPGVPGSPFPGGLMGGGTSYGMDRGMAQAEVLYRRVLEHQPAHAGALLDYAGMVYNAAERRAGGGRSVRRNVDLAAELWGRVLQQQPGHVDALFFLARLEFRHRRRYKRAERHLKRLLHEAPDHFNGLAIYARLQHDQGRYVGALDAYERAIAMIEPPIRWNHPDVVVGLADILLYFRKEPNRARSLYVGLLRLNPLKALAPEGMRGKLCNICTNRTGHDDLCCGRTSARTDRWWLPPPPIYRYPPRSVRGRPPHH